ncbi:RNA-directed DNA polymerase, eukaryota, reverse transcriptase zinc-binding domain protein [Tanacetum coccineum]
MNKRGTKMSKIDRFLVSHSVMDSFHDLKVTDLPHGWPNHTSLLLHYETTNYGPVPFKKFHSWLQRDIFNECIVNAYTEYSQGNPRMTFPDKFKVIKQKIKSWNLLVKNIEVCRIHEVRSRLTDIDGKIDIDKFKALDSTMYLSTAIMRASLNTDDNIELDKVVAVDEIRVVVWDCVEAVKNAFDSLAISKGANSSVITLIPKGLVINEGGGFKCVYSARALILVNEISSSEFLIKRGLRQDDPLIPFLFIIVMEGLHLALKDAVATGLLRGTNVGNTSFNILHLFYADDVVIISDWNMQEMDNIIRILHVFYLASGLKLNIYKPHVYGLNMSLIEIEHMACDTRCSSGNIPFSYLRVKVQPDFEKPPNPPPSKHKNTF